MRAGITISGGMQKGLSQNTHWRWEGGDNDLPQQPNGWDCGVFVVMMIACIVRGWTFWLLTRVSGVKIRAWLLETITSDSSRMRARECAKCGIAIDWEVVTSPVVTMLQCREAKECKTRCQRNRLKRRESVETWEVEVMNVTEHETSDIKKVTTQGKVESKDGKQGRTADLRKPESSTSKVRKAGSAKNGNIRRTITQEKVGGVVERRK
jgi:Ulp1 family protease